MARTLLDYLQNPGSERQALGSSIVSLIQDTDFVTISAPFRASLVPDRGPMPTYFTGQLAAAGLPSTVDCFGMLKTCNPGEALFHGARRVENLIRFSEHLSRTTDNMWTMLNGAVVTPVTNPARPGKHGDMTAWKLGRSAVANSVLRTDRALQYNHGVGGLDLLLPVPYFVGINIRRAETNVVTTAEPRIYTSGGAVHATKVVTITDEMQTFGLSFTPQEPRQITALSWSGGVLTVTCPSHGYAAGMLIRLSGSVPVEYDSNAAVASVVNASTFTVAMASNPGMLVVAGLTQPQYHFGISPGSWASTGLGDIEIEMPYVSDMLGYDAGLVPEYVARGRVPQRKYWHGAAVDGVRYFDTATAWSHDTVTGLVTEAAGAALETCRGVTTYANTVNAIHRRHAEGLSGWMKSDASVTVSDRALAGPTGDVEASRLTEGTHTGRHYVQLPAGQLVAGAVADGLTSCITVYLATPGGTSGRDWAVLSFTDKAGVEHNGYFDIATGATGSKDAGMLHLNCESLGTIQGLTYFRVHASVLVGSGSNSPVLRIGLAASNGSVSYAGGGTRYVAVWGACFSGTGVSRPVAGPYGRRNLNEGAQLAGALVTFNASGFFGSDNLSACSTYTPYYDFYQPGRVSWAASIYFRCEPAQSVFAANSSTLNSSGLERFGIIIRPNFGVSSVPNHMTKVAFDHYNGEVCQYHLFVAGSTYQAGDVVLPTDIQPNNANGRKLWTVVSGGVAGAEPAWPAVSTLPSATVTSGGVTFQVIHDNGIGGNFEPYNGAHLQPPQGFMSTMTAGFLFTADDYAAFVNGQEMEKQTLPQPVNPVLGCATRSPISTIVFGAVGGIEAIDPTTASVYALGSLLDQMPRHTAFHRDVVVWNAAKTPAYMAAFTGGL